MLNVATISFIFQTGKYMNKTLLLIPALVFTLTACSKPTHQGSEDIQTTAQTQAAKAHEAATPTVDSDDHSSENNLNWVGEYKGLLPCADCSGIETELELKADQTYELEEEYKGGKSTGEKIKVKGQFKFDSNQHIVTLDQSADKRKFFIGENFIEERDRNTGEKMEGALAEHNKLTKSLH